MPTGQWWALHTSREDQGVSLRMAELALVSARTVCVCVCVCVPGGNGLTLSPPPPPAVRWPCCERFWLNRGWQT